MNRFVLYALVIMIIYLYIQRRGGKHRISAKEVYALLQEERDFTLLDVRSEGEFHSGHIEGAVNLPVEYISSVRPTSLPDLNEEIIVYCRSGARSRVAAQKLSALGYTNVKEMGGLLMWRYGLVK